MSRRSLIRSLAFCALSLCMAAPAFAQATNQPQLPPPVDRSGSIEGRKKVTAAQAEQAKAKAALEEVIAKLRTDFEGGDEWKNASTALAEAQAEHDKLRKPIVEGVKKNPAYLKADADKRKAEEQLAEYRLNRTFGDPVLAAAQKRADASAEMTRIENEALNADEKYVEWRKKLQEATAQVNMLKKQFETTAQTDMAVMEAKKALEMAQQAVVAANKEVTDALAREREAEKQRQEQIRQIRQTQRGY